MDIYCVYILYIHPEHRIKNDVSEQEREQGHLRRSIDGASGRSTGALRDHFHCRKRLAPPFSPTMSQMKSDLGSGTVLFYGGNIVGV